MNIGQQISKYIIEEKIGDGGFGDVFLARDIHTKMAVAIKCSRPSDSKKLPDHQQRFLREVSCTTKLVHPNIVQVYEYGALNDGTLYLVMELIRGRNLEELIKEYAPFPFRFASTILLQILGALDHAHAQSIIHRDLKPANIMLIPNGDSVTVKLLDFGIAKALDGTQPDLTRQNFNEGVGFGTPQYMPPEQFFGKNMGPHSDIYAIGLVYFELLTGFQAFRGKSLSEIIRKQLKSFPDIPAPFNQGPIFDIFRKALAKDISMRYANGPEMAADITEIFSTGLAYLKLYEKVGAKSPALNIMSLDKTLIKIPVQPAPLPAEDNTHIFDSIDNTQIKNLSLPAPDDCTVILNSLDESALTDDIKSLGDDNDFEDLDPTDDLSRINPSVAYPRARVHSNSVTAPDFSQEYNTVTQSIEYTKRDEVDFSNVETLMVKPEQWGDLASESAATFDARAISEDEEYSPVFHNQRTKFLQHRNIPRNLRPTILGQESLPVRLLTRLSLSPIGLKLRSLLHPTPPRKKLNLGKRIVSMVSELYEWHFAALVVAICLLVVIFTVLVILLVMN